MEHAYKIISSPVGPLTLVANSKGLAAILWAHDDPKRVPLGTLTADDRHPTLLATERALARYFKGDRTAFSLTVSLSGTVFQKQVWSALANIPHGQTRTYAEIAQQIGRPAAVRAVGAAIGRNPVSIVVPCHRVVGSNGKLTGFAGGLPAKAFLLKLEARS